MYFEKVILENLQILNNGIKSNLMKHGTNNTMKASESLKVVKKNKTTFQSTGIDYLEILNRGRSKGSYAPVSKIRDWVRTKLGITDERENKSVAFLVNRKLKKEGSDIFLKKRKGIELSDLIENSKADLRKNITDKLKIETQELLNKFKKQFNDK